MSTIVTPLTNADDLEILARTLMARYSKALLGYAERLLGDHHLAEDVVQEALIRALRHPDHLDGQHGSVRGWLLTVVRNLSVDRLRTPIHRYEVSGLETRDAGEHDVANAVLDRVDAVRYLRQLSPDHRDVLVQAFLLDQSEEQTAKNLGIPPGTVKSRRHYALISVRRSLTTWPPDNTAVRTEPAAVLKIVADVPAPTENAWSPCLSK